jgi:hypothetical protein
MRFASVIHDNADCVKREAFPVQIFRIRKNPVLVIGLSSAPLVDYFTPTSSVIYFLLRAALNRSGPRPFDDFAL